MIDFNDSDYIRARLLAYIEKNNIKPTPWGLSAGLSRNALSQFLNHPERNISAKSLQKLADHEGINIEALLGVANKVIPSQAYQQSLSQQGSHAGGMQGAAYGQYIIKFPLYGRASATTDGRYATNQGEHIDMIDGLPGMEQYHDAFVLEVFGDSMEPRYFDGEYIFAVPTRVMPKQFCVVQYHDGSSIVKQYLGQDDKKIRLKQFNPDEEIEVDLEDVHQIYRVKGMRDR